MLTILLMTIQAVHLITESTCVSIKSDVSWPNWWDALAKGNSDLKSQWGRILQQKQWGGILKQKQNSSYFSTVLGDCALTPNPQDGVKSIVWSGLVTENPLDQPPGTLTSRTGFPLNYHYGIGISSGPPPKERFDQNGKNIWTDYKTKNENQWNERFKNRYPTEAAALQAADQALKEQLDLYKGQGIITQYMTVKGIYEQCEEVSYIAEIAKDKREEYAEVLRAYFGQDSVLYYDERQPLTNPEDCGADSANPNDPEHEPEMPLNNQVRPFGLYFGLGGPIGDPDPKTGTKVQILELGKLCKFNNPTSPEEFPEACSISGDGKTMWASTSLKYAEYRATKTCF